MRIVMYLLSKTQLHAITSTKSHRVLCVPHLCLTWVLVKYIAFLSLANQVNCNHRQEPKAAHSAEAATTVAEVLEAPAVEAAQPAEAATEIAEVLEAPAMEAESVADSVVEPSQADKAVAEQQVTAFCHAADLG